LDLFTFKGKKKILTSTGKDMYQRLKTELNSIASAWEDVRKDAKDPEKFTLKDWRQKRNSREHC
jgi:hypothetical protein